jgi:hypothetical protein
MFIDPKIQNSLSPMSQHMVSQLPAKQQEVFWQQYTPQYKDPGKAFLFAWFGFSLAYLGQIGLFIPFLITCGGCGIWSIIELINAKARAIKINDELAQRIMMMIKSSN